MEGFGVFGGRLMGRCLEHPESSKLSGCEA